MLFPAYFICKSFSATIFDSVGIYPALLAVSTVPIVYSSKFAESQKTSIAFMNGICLAGGFAATALFLGAVRELLASGSLWGFKITEVYLPAAKLPFWGFIFLGFMAAMVNFVSERIGRKEKIQKGEEETK